MGPRFTVSLYFELAGRRSIHCGSIYIYIYCICIVPFVLYIYVYIWYYRPWIDGSLSAFAIEWRLLIQCTNTHIYNNWPYQSTLEAQKTIEHTLGVCVCVYRETVRATEWGHGSYMVNTNSQQRIMMGIWPRPNVCHEDEESIHV